jgi:hypothetical protein
LKTKITLNLCIIAFVMIFLTSISACAQEQELEFGADVNAYIQGDISPIKGNWTSITVNIKDSFGIHWESLRDSAFNIKFGRDFRFRVIWPILYPAFPKPLSDYLGYTALRFEPEIIEGNPEGWFVRIIDNHIPQTDQGWNHTITIDARTDDSAIDYSVVIGIKVIRESTTGRDIGANYIRIPVKASPGNYVKMRSVEDTMQYAGLKKIVYYDVDIINDGYYKDVFQFELEEENGLLALADKQAMVLSPGETGRVKIGILTPEKLIDWGTPNIVDVYVYSTGDKTRTLVGSLVVYTRGIYISPLVGIILAPILFIIALIGFWFYIQKTKKEEKLVKKPEKPWTIPIEQQHLEKLKEKDEKAYEQELEMMKDEYQSAMLWYNEYKKVVMLEEKNKKISDQKLKTQQKQIEQKSQKKEKNQEQTKNKNNTKSKKIKQKSKQKKQIKPSPKPTPSEKKKPSKELEMEQKKQKVLEKIRKEQRK